MIHTERAMTIRCGDTTLVGILSRPEQARQTGVLVLVGGPQYRAGSHRQFVLLARRLASEGYPVLRFDFGGTGDSTGAPTDFESTGPNIAAAMDALVHNAPSVRKVVIWGLCDAASAALLDWDARKDPRVVGYCLLNPWVRSATTFARTQIRHYYWQRLASPDFWKKLLGGRVGIGRAFGELVTKIRMASRPAAPTADRHSGSLETLRFQEKMARALRGFSGHVLLILSSKDLTAREFLEYARTAREWQGLLERDNLTRIDVPDADHTFSTAEWRGRVEQACIDWLASIDRDLVPT
jgi:exosortase A-associated hydrolase 1